MCRLPIVNRPLDLDLEQEPQMSAALNDNTPARRRTDWPRALRAIKALRANVDDIRHAYEVMIALDGGQMETVYQRFLGEPAAAALLVERPSLLATLADSETLLRLPAGSFGRAYMAMMKQSGYSADGLLQASRLAKGLEEILPGADRQWFIERSGCIHDLLHVLTGYGQDWAGETSLLAFDCGLEPMRARIVGLVGTALTAPWWPNLWVHRFLRRAWLRGKRARIPLSYRWEEALQRPLDAVRLELAIEPVLIAHPQGILAGGQTLPWRYAVSSIA
jgi:ubiquinone biosynthesis protein COQ4